MSEISASVINSLVGEAPFVKCPDVQALTEKTAVEMANVTVQTISASVYQVGKWKLELCYCGVFLVATETALEEKQFK